MPIYEYVCTACDHRTDILQGINDPPPNYCPACGAEGTLRKQFAPPAIHYKGSGWAKKDRGSTSSGTRASRSSSGDGAKEGGSSGEGSPGGSWSGTSGGSGPSGSSGSTGSTKPGEKD